MDLQQLFNLKEALAERSKFSTAIETLITVLNIVTAIGGNLLVCWTIYKISRLQTTANLYIACLAVSDVLIAGLGYPLTLAVLLTGRWPFNKPACDFQGMAFTSFGTLSLLIMALTATARYLKVTRPNLHRKIYSARRVVLSVSLAFFLSTVFPVLLSVKDGYSFHPGKFICIYDCERIGAPVCVTMGVFLVVVCFGPIVFCHERIFHAVRQHNQQLEISRENRWKKTKVQIDEAKVTKLLATIVFAFACCWTPLLVIDGIGLLFGNYWMPRGVYMAYTYLSGYSSSVNPIIYGIFNRHLRREFFSIVTCMRSRRTRVCPIRACSRPSHGRQASD